MYQIKLIILICPSLSFIIVEALNFILFYVCYSVVAFAVTVDLELQVQVSPLAGMPTTQSVIPATNSATRAFPVHCVVKHIGHTLIGRWCNVVFVEGKHYLIHMTPLIQLLNIKVPL